MQPESVDESRRLWCNRIKGLEDTRDLWVHRVVATLFPIEEMDKEEGGGVNLEVYNFNNDDTAVGIEAHLWDDQEYFAIIKGYYNLGDQFPKFVFHYFSC